MNNNCKKKDKVKKEFDSTVSFIHSYSDHQQLVLTIPMDNFNFNRCNDVGMNDYLSGYISYRKVHEPGLPSVEELMDHPTFRGIKVPCRNERSSIAEGHMERQDYAITATILSFCPQEEGRVIAVEDSWNRFREDVKTLNSSVQEKLDFNNARVNWTRGDGISSNDRFFQDLGAEER